MIRLPGDRRSARAGRVGDGLGAGRGGGGGDRRRNLKKVVLELGGSDPFILSSTDHLDATVEVAVAARLDNAADSHVTRQAVRRDRQGRSAVSGEVHGRDDVIEDG